MNGEEVPMTTQKASRAMRVAIALSGKVGLPHGRFHDGRASPNESTVSWRAIGNCLRQRIDAFNASGASVKVFVHSWDEHFSPLIHSMLRPENALFEPQMRWPKAEHLRQCTLLPQLSMWQSRLKSLELVAAYERRVLGKRFDLVHVGRLDLCYCQPLSYEPLPGNKRIGVAGGIRDDGVAWSLSKRRPVQLQDAKPGSRWQKPCGPPWNGLGDGASCPTPRVHDTSLVGESSALLSIARDIIEDATSCEPSTDPYREQCKTNGCDAHAMLGAALQRQYAKGDVHFFSGMKGYGLGPATIKTAAVAKSWKWGVKVGCFARRGKRSGRADG